MVVQKLAKCFVLMMCLLAPASAQGQRMVLRTRGPAGRVRAMCFSPDSRVLYVAGEDKTVSVYVLSEQNNQLALQYARTLRWEISRSTNGVIRTLAHHPAQPSLAIAGEAARYQGDIVLFDSGNEEIKHALPVKRDYVEQPDGSWAMKKGHEGHGDNVSVVDLEFSPRGTSLASLSEDGELVLWSGEKFATFNRLRAAKASAHEASLAFLNETKLLVTDHQKTPASLASVDVSSEQPWANRTVLHSLDGADYFTDVCANGANNSWAAADSRGRIFVFTDGNRIELTRPQPERVPTQIRFIGKEKLGVITTLPLKEAGNSANENDFGHSCFELYDIAKNTCDRVTKVSETSQLFALAVSPDSKYVAWSNPDDDSVHVTTADESAAPVDVASDGQKSFVAFNKDPNDDDWFAFSKFQDANGLPTTQPGKTRYFNLFDLRLMSKPKRPILRPKAIGGWDVKTTDSPLEFVVENSELGIRKQMPTPRGGRISCSCVLSDSDGRAFAFAIGHTEDPDIYVFSLPGKSADARLLRTYRRHTSDVHDLSQSADGRFLLSGSRDQTIRIWSLENLDDVVAKKDAPADGVKYSSVLGMSYRQANGRSIEVLRVDKAGVARNKGLKAGDVLTQMYVGSMDSGDVSTNLSNLHKHVGKYVEIFFQRNNKPQESLYFMPAWDCLLTLYVNAANEWILMSPSGYFLSSAAEGQNFGGWQLNNGRSKSPKTIFGGKELLEQFENKRVIERMLDEADPQPSTDGNLKNQLKQRARLIVNTPRLDRIYPPGSSINIEGTVENADGLTLRAYINGRPVPVQLKNGRITGSATALSRMNILRIVALKKNDDSTPVAAMNTPFRAAVTQEQQQKVRLHYLILGAANYRGDFQALPAAKKDAESFEELIQNHKGEFYEVTKDSVTIRLLNEKITKSAFSQAVDQLSAAAKPDDLVVVFVAGHGTVKNGMFYFVPVNVAKTDVVDQGISWTDMLRLQSVSCRKVIALDACHSGFIAGQLKAAIRPLAAAQMLVMAATSADGQAIEIQGQHGIFTNAILSGVDQGLADGRHPLDPRDDLVTVRELGRFVKLFVEEQADRGGLSQRPALAPSDIWRYAGQPLAKPKSAGKTLQP